MAPSYLLAALALALGARADPHLSAHLAASFPLKGIAVTAVTDKFPGSASPSLLATTYAGRHPWNATTSSSHHALTERSLSVCTDSLCGFAAFGKTPSYFIRDLAAVSEGQVHP